MLPDNNADRYRRQTRFTPWGQASQQRLGQSQVLICGCGALGSVVADLLVRAGVGRIKLVDRDFVQHDNLHRQVLFTEADATEQLPKAVAAATRLRQVNSTVTIEPIVADLNAANISQLAEGCDVLVDGTDNFETRFLLNDFAVCHNRPWVFAGCVGAEGQVLAILPGETPCLTCFLPEPPPATSLPTCETAGVLAPIVGAIASCQAMEAMKLCSGNRAAVNRQLIVFDLWNNRLRSIDMQDARRDDCPTCGQRQFPWLAGERGSAVTLLCGRNTVQILPVRREPLELSVLARRLEQLGAVIETPFFVRLSVEGCELTVFPDGRTLVFGTDDPAVARTLQAKYIGS